MFPSSNFLSESQKSFSSLDDRCWIKPLSIWNILLSSYSTDGSHISESISANGSNGSTQVSQFFSAFVIPPALHSPEINLFPFGCGHVILEITKSFHMNRFQGIKSEFNLNLFDFFAFTKLLSYLIGIPFIKISKFSKLEFCGNKFCGWPKIFRNSRNEISRLTKDIEISLSGKNIAKPGNFLPAKISDNKVV